MSAPDDYAALIAEARGEVHRPEEARKIRYDLADALEAMRAECDRIRVLWTETTIAAVHAEDARDDALARADKAEQVIATAPARRYLAEAVVNADLRAKKAERERDDARAAIERVRAVCDSQQPRHPDKLQPCDFHCVQQTIAEVRAALDGEAKS